MEISLGKNILKFKHVNWINQMEIIAEKYKNIYIIPPILSLTQH
jgi:hypothetical protein